MGDHSPHSNETGNRHAWPEFGGAVRLPAAMRRPGAAQAAQLEYEHGFEAGRAAGLAAAADEVRALKDRLATSIRTLEQTRIRVDAAQQQRLVELTRAICSKVLGLELTTEPRVFEACVRRGVEQLDVTSEAVRVHVNPNDAHALHAALPDLAIEADATIAEGGCSVRTDERSVDFDPHGLLDELFTELRNG